MRLVGRILVVLGVATFPTVVMLIGCDVDISHLPGLPNELPNMPGVPVGPSSSTSSSSSSSTSGTTTASTTTATEPAQSLCDCAAGFEVASVGSACQMCESANCQAQYDNWQAEPAGMTTTQCVFTCGSAGPCISTCIDDDPGYALFLNCLFLDGCAQTCGVSSPISNCTAMVDAGTD
jgi:hypothetical protein